MEGSGSKLSKPRRRRHISRRRKPATGWRSFRDGADLAADPPGALADRGRSGWNASGRPSPVEPAPAAHAKSAAELLLPGLGAGRGAGASLAALAEEAGRGHQAILAATASAWCWWARPGRRSIPRRGRRSIPRQAARCSDARRRRTTGSASWHQALDQLDVDLIGFLDTAGTRWRRARCPWSRRFWRSTRRTTSSSPTKTGSTPSGPAGAAVLQAGLGCRSCSGGATWSGRSHSTGRRWCVGRAWPPGRPGATTWPTRSPPPPGTRAASATCPPCCATARTLPPGHADAMRGGDWRRSWQRDMRGGPGWSPPPGRAGPSA